MSTNNDFDRIERSSRNRRIAVRTITYALLALWVACRRLPDWVMLGLSVLSTLMIIGVIQGLNISSDGLTAKQRARQREEELDSGMI